MAGGIVGLVFTRFVGSEDRWGSHVSIVYDINVPSGAYPTNGYSLDPVNFGQLNVFKALETVDFHPFGSSAVGLVYTYDPVNKSMRVFQSAGFTPAGTLAAPVVTVTGSQATGVALQITPDSNSAVLGKTTATTLSVPGATFGIAAPVFTGTAQGAAGLVELSGTVGGANFNVRCRFIGF